MKPVTAAPKPKAEKPFPGVTPRDHVFCKIGGRPVSGRVLAMGNDGVTLHIAGKRYPVRWGEVLGIKKRANRALSVVDHGEDGAILEDERGNRTFAQGYEEPSEPDRSTNNNELIPVQDMPRAKGELAKSMPVALVIGASAEMFAKGGPIKNRPGLTLRDVTDKNGRRGKRWAKTGQDEKRSKKPAAAATKKPAARATAEHDERGSGKGYGTHNVEEGDRIEFQLGALKGSGVAGNPGPDGVIVRDETGHDHDVPFDAIRGHDKRAAAKPADKPPQVLGEQKPIPADKFSAADYAKSHDKADVRPEDIMAEFPADTGDKIASAQQRLKAIEETIKTFKVEKKYSPARRKVHVKIIEHFINAKSIAEATPPEGQKPTFTMLGGRGGSGKSYFKGKVVDDKHAIYLDADEIKGMLPEFEGWNAHQVHEESSDLFDEITDVAEQNGLNVVHDATMKTPEKAVKLVQRFKDAGYRVETHYMHLPRQEAAKRAVGRFIGGGKNGRYVPTDVVLGNTENEKAFDQVRKMADKWSFRDNNVARGQDPILISEGENQG